MHHINLLAHHYASTLGRRESPGDSAPPVIIILLREPKGSRPLKKKSDNTQHRVNVKRRQNGALPKPHALLGENEKDSFVGMHHITWEELPWLQANIAAFLD